MMAAPNGRGRDVFRDLAVNLASSAIRASSSSGAVPLGFFRRPDKTRPAFEVVPILEISMRRSSRAQQNFTLTGHRRAPLQSFYDHLSVDHPRPPPPTGNRSSAASSPRRRGPGQFQSEPQPQYLSLAGPGMDPL